MIIMDPQEMENFATGCLETASLTKQHRDAVDGAGAARSWYKASATANDAAPSPALKFGGA